MASLSSSVAVFACNLLVVFWQQQPKCFHYQLSNCAVYAVLIAYMPTRSILHISPGFTRSFTEQSQAHNCRLDKGVVFVFAAAFCQPDMRHANVIVCLWSSITIGLIFHSNMHIRVHIKFRFDHVFKEISLAFYRIACLAMALSALSNFV